jgi:hypothetical protein
MSKTKKTTSKEHKQKQATAKATPTRPEGFVGKLNGLDSEDGPRITGTNVDARDVIEALEDGDSRDTVCEDYGIVPEDIDACIAWWAKQKAKEPPNPDEPRELPPTTPLEVRKVELSAVVPGGPVVLERMQRTLLVSLTEAELDEKRRQVFVASRTLRDANDKLVAVRAEIKRVTEHERALHAIIDRGQEDRSVQCERVLEGTLTKLYRVDRIECIETRAALDYERQLTLGVE